MMYVGCFLLGMLAGFAVWFMVNCLARFVSRPGDDAEQYWANRE
jgi:hypothetical protein